MYGRSRDAFQFESCMSSFHWLVQDDVSSKQKQKEDQKKLKEAQAKAAQKGPMGGPHM